MRVLVEVGLTPDLAIPSNGTVLVPECEALRHCAQRNREDGMDRAGGIAATKHHQSGIWLENGLETMNLSASETGNMNREPSPFSKCLKSLVESGRALLLSVAQLAFLSANVLLAAPAVRPNITSQPVDTDVFYSSNAVFEVTADGTAPLRFQWFKDSSLIWSATNSMLTVSNTSWFSPGSYTVIVTNLGGAITSNPALLRVHVKPGMGYFPSQPVTEIPYNGELYVEILQSGVNGDRFQWQFDGQDIPGATNTVFRVPNAKPADAGWYRYISFQAAGPLYSEPIYFSVGRQNPVQHSGREVVLSAGNGSGLIQSYQWFHANSLIEGQTNASLRLEPVLTADGGDYSCRLVQNNVERIVEVARLTILPRPTLGRVIYWSSEESGPLILSNNLENVIQISAQEGNHVALFADGTMINWGASGCDAFQRATEISNVVAVAAGEIGNLALLNDGTVTAWSGCYCEACFVPPITNAIAIAAGQSHGLALLNDRSVKVWGSAGTLPANLANVTSIAAGYLHSLALTVDGSVVTWKHGSPNPSLDVPAGLNSVVAIACGSVHSLALKSDGTVIAWGSNFSGQSSVPPELVDVRAIGAGALHSYAIKRDGTVIVWGSYDSSYPLGVPGVVTNPIAVTGGRHTSLALLPLPLQSLPPLGYLPVAEGSWTLSWTSSGTLQSAPNVFGPYTNVPTSGTSYTTPVDQARRFFRLKN